jgi:hypothetical protein
VTGGLGGGGYYADQCGSRYRNVYRRPCLCLFHQPPDRGTQRRRDTPSPIHQWTGDANGRDDARTEYYSTGTVGLFCEHRARVWMYTTLHYSYDSFFPNIVLLLYFTVRYSHHYYHYYYYFQVLFGKII